MSRSSFSFGAVECFGQEAISNKKSCHEVTIGELCETREDTLSIQWKINRFLTLSGGAGTEFQSSLFNFLGVTWYLVIYPYGDSKGESLEWIAVYLKKKDCNTSKIVTFELGAMKADNTLCFKQKFTREFKDCEMYGIKYLLKRLELLEQEDELTPSDTLTIICKLKSFPPPTEMNTAFATGLKDILASKKHSDVTLQVKGQEFAAHKNILAASSQVFSAMFQHDMLEKESGVVNIPDCEPDSFKDFLHFLYSGRTDITDSNVYQLYITANKYCVEDLITHCVAFMLKNLSVDNICDVVALGHQYLDSDIIFHCKNFFKDKIQQILVTKQWMSLLKENPLVAYKLLEDIASKIILKE